jgi:glycine/D-amino acid oxidase-like deaminating enzyme/nitrite reductase/ring-hydroxylating ferredoxin subunit
MQDHFKSIWIDTIQSPSFPSLTSDIETEIVVVGAGITGITTAYLLAKQGKKVVVLESDKVGSGVTAFSTGHLTASLDADYSFVSSRINKNAARQTAQSMQAAIDRIEQICREENIDCDFVRLSAYQYTEDAKKAKEIEDEAQASTEAGLDVRLMDTVPLPFAVIKAFEIKNQAEFNALKYIYGLANCITQHGGQIYQGAHVTDVDDSEPCVVTTKDGKKIRANKVILATHTPIQFNITQAEMIAYRSYSIAVLLASQQIAKGLYWDMLKHYHYIRTYEKDGESYLIVGGEDHKVGEDKFDENEAFEKLEKYTREKFKVLKITHRWSAQHFESSDGLPYIGVSPFGKNKYIATGFTGDGLTFGVVSAMLLTDMLTGKENALEKLYSPSRANILASAQDWAEENLTVMYRFVKDRLTTDAGDITEVEKGEGKILKIDGKQLAVYRDEQDQVHALSPVCTHMHCIVQWNNSEKSWDCPCHGARYDALGNVITGPAVRALAPHQIEINAESKKGK